MTGFRLGWQGATILLRLSLCLTGLLLSLLLSLVLLVLCPLLVFAVMGPPSLVTATPGAAWLHDLAFFRIGPARFLMEWQAMVPVLWSESGWAWFVMGLACLYGAGGALFLAPFVGLFHTHSQEK